MDDGIGPGTNLNSLSCRTPSSGSYLAPRAPRTDWVNDLIRPQVHRVSWVLATEVTMEDFSATARRGGGGRRRETLPRDKTVLRVTLSLFQKS